MGGPILVRNVFGIDPVLRKWGFGGSACHVGGVDPGGVGVVVGFSDVANLVRQHCSEGLYRGVDEAITDTAPAAGESPAVESLASSSLWSQQANWTMSAGRRPSENAG